METLDSDRLKELRLKSGVRVQDVAKYAGINRTSLWRYENGIEMPRTDTLCRMLECYRGTTKDVFRTVNIL